MVNSNSESILKLDTSNVFSHKIHNVALCDYVTLKTQLPSRIDMSSRGTK